MLKLDTNVPLSPALLTKIQAMCAAQCAKENLFEDQSFYVPAVGSVSQFSQHVFDLEGAVQEFLASEKKVLLLLGESGSGKSLFTQNFIAQKAKEYKTGDVIPLFTSLPTLHNPVNHLMQEALQRYQFTPEEIATLKQTQTFCLVLDAFDEINKLENLLITNQLEQWQGKIIISCRMSYLTQVDNYRRYFTFYKGEGAHLSHFQELHVAPFVAKQIDHYIRNYLSVKEEELNKAILENPELTKEWLDPQTYHHWINSIPGLATLVQNPFLLRITMEVLPTIVAEYQAVQNDPQMKFKMTGAKLYDAFTDRWFVRQEEKLLSKGLNPSRTFKKDCMAFAKALAKKMHEKNIMQVRYEKESAMEDLFGDTQTANPEQEEWAPFFSDDMIPQDKNNPERQQARIQARKACPLRNVGPGQYAFIHASLLDYFFTLTIVGSLPKPAEHAKNSPNMPAAQPKPSTATATTQRRRYGDFVILDPITRQEAEELSREEGIFIEFAPNAQEASGVLGKGHFGRFVVARNITNRRFAGAKEIYTEAKIKESKEEAEIQFQLNGLSNIMPLWYSQEDYSTPQQAVLIQIMPLAGLGNGEEMRDMLHLIRDDDLKVKFLLHLAKQLFTGLKNMHRRKICHLDLKPANVVLNAQGTLYIIDFGCAHRDYQGGLEHRISGGKGDTRYAYSPERLDNCRYHLKKPTFSDPKAHESYDAEKVDVWSGAVTQLDFILERYSLEYASFEDKLSHWDNQYHTQYFADLFAVRNHPLIPVLKKALLSDPNERLNAEGALSDLEALERREGLAIKPDEIKHVIGILVKAKQKKSAATLPQGLVDRDKDYVDAGQVEALLPTTVRTGSYAEVLKPGAEKAEPQPSAQADQATKPKPHPALKKAPAFINPPSPQLSPQTPDFYAKTPDNVPPQPEQRALNRQSAPDKVEQSPNNNRVQVEPLAKREEEPPRIDKQSLLSAYTRIQQTINAGLKSKKWLTLDTNIVTSNPKTSAIRDLKKEVNSLQQDIEAGRIASVSAIKDRLRPSINAVIKSAEDKQKQTFWGGRKVTQSSIAKRFRETVLSQLEKESDIPASGIRGSGPMR